MGAQAFRGSAQVPSEPLVDGLSWHRGYPLRHADLGPLASDPPPLCCNPLVAAVSTTGELLLGHSGGETREHPTSQAGGGGGTGSDDEVLPDRTAEVAAESGPSEQPPETGHIRTMTVRRTTNSQ